MSQKLVIWLAEDLSAPWAWTIGDAKSGWAGTGDERAALAELGASSVSVVCPGQWVRMFRHELPAMKAKDRLRAAGYAIEDQLAAPLSDQHVVIEDEPVRRIGVISAEKMSAISSALAEANIHPDRLVADYSILPDGNPVVLFDREVQPGPLGFAIDREFDERAVLPRASSLNWGDGLNLLQGDYQVRRALSFDTRRLLRAAALLAIAGVSWLIWQGSQIRAMNAQAAELKTQMNTLYTEATGEAAPANVAAVVNRARTNNQGQSEGFLELSSALFAGLSDADGVMVDTLRYDRSRNEIILRLIYPSFESATLLENTYGNAGYVFRSGAVREQGSDLIGEAVFSSEAQL